MVLAIVRHPSLVRSTCQASLVDHSLLRLFLIDPIISIHYVVAMESAADSLPYTDCAALFLELSCRKSRRS